MSSDFARKMASVNFGSKNTWDDWRMVPVDRPIISEPGLKTNIVDIPAANGQIDLMHALIGYPVYKNRTGTLKFRLVNVDAESVQSRVNEIARHLHGVYMDMILDDEPQYYYSGFYEVTATSYKKAGENGEITIKYNLDPYKYSVATTDEEWLWDTFNFETGVIPQGTIVNATVAGIEDGGVTLTNIGVLVGSKTVRPTVVISNNSTNITFKVYSSNTGTWSEHVYKAGTDQIVTGSTGLKFDRYSEKLNITGYGKYSLNFRAGAL